ncbi:hypothetical protein IMZ08_17435 [Bacillus luteolus]|uniref:Uncharacterized protein n=1 Tax=Litchfieldia luteola TaxID=682179 RepID=A0ABR9QMS9_9BACI|nr:hypothetical protein [Cytobacillus luteolus]MBE4909820.1 hypothetical protein [Cytobacillus luteolus]MBP1942631.1 hypothetical protein [Cytobacillus luteolus]
MNTRKEEKPPAFYLFIGIAFLLLGIGNLTLLLKPGSFFELILGLSGIPAIIGAVILLKEYLQLDKQY